jgi:hypothetical protein
MVEEPPPAARFFVFVVAIVLFALAGVVHMNAGPAYLWGTAILAAIGAIYLGLFLFGSTRACYNAALCLTLGATPWEW